MLSKWCLPFALVVLFAGSAMATEITFQVSEVNLGQDSAVTTSIGGSEWLTFGFNMLGTSLLVYGPPNPDPFAPATDQNGVFEVAGDSMEFVFNSPVTNLELDWFSPGMNASTFVVFDASGVATQVVVNPGGLGQKTELFSGAVKRLVVQTAPATVCIANLRFTPITAVPALSPRALALAAVLFVSLLAVILIRRDGPSLQV